MDDDPNGMKRTVSFAQLLNCAMSLPQFVQNVKVDKES